jgi:hypothetical protein
MKTDKEYFVGTVEDTEYVEEVFENAKYFGGDNGEYRAARIEVEVTDEGIEYDITQEVHEGIVNEFVDGIVRSFEDVDEDFRENDVREEFKEESEQVYADGGYTMKDVDHGTHDDVQNVMDRGDEDSPDKIADGGFKGIPIGGAPNYAEQEDSTEKEGMGDHPM